MTLVGWFVRYFVDAFPFLWSLAKRRPYCTFAIIFCLVLSKRLFENFNTSHLVWQLLGIAV